MGKCAIFDIDMTIIDSAWVWKYLAECGTFSNAYDKYGDQDVPIQGTIDLIKNLDFSCVEIIFLSARPEEDRARTENSLKKLFPNMIFNLILVGYSDGIAERKETVLKDIQANKDIMFFIDDDRENCIRANRLGITTFNILT